MNFDSYHWQEAELEEPKLARARSRMASGQGSEEDFLALLRSDCIIAKGVAFDQFTQADSLTRFGDSNPFSTHEDEILTRAREVLRNPPVLKSETGAYEDGADHSSALFVMSNLANPESLEDCHLIATAVRKASTRTSVEAATAAAGAVLPETSPINEDLLDSLAGIILDDSRDVWDRVRGIVALSNVTDRKAGDLLAQATRQQSKKIRLEAAIILCSRHMSTHWALLEEMTSTWPEDTPYPESIVLDALKRRKGS